ncbi:putative retrotransposable element Tf2 155 kDa protein type 1-like [Lyophyllum shimeji]|uniref:Retrotransposable element Tf2 155 kDa protein type 1-like n=1 Tax=Lyophyllum shimeji TaxID=47721 RepID=A0A9P3PMM5_LYOSH|nr:putative retrotransposable element Tf2 155 kDa protein type 1-like [Lyophyllum shimeji]
MVNAIDAKVFQQIRSRLRPLQLSSRVLRMADGRLVPSDGIWEGTVVVANTSQEGAFEVFESGGAWSLLFGKPLLEEFGAVHEYKADTIHLPIGNSWVKLENQFSNVKGVAAPLLVGLTTDIKQRTNFRGDHCASPSRQVLAAISVEARVQLDQPHYETLEPSNTPTWTRPGRKERRRVAQEWKQKAWAQTNHGGDELPPTRQVSIPESTAVVEQFDQQTSITESEASEAIVAIDEGEQEEDWVPVKVEHPKTSTGELRRTKEEREAWRLQKGLTARRTRGDRKQAKRFREGRVKRARAERLEASRANSMGDSRSPSREVHSNISSNCEAPISDVPTPTNAALEPEGEPEEHWSAVYTLDAAAGDSDEHPGAEQPLLAMGFKPSILTRRTDPFKKERVDAVLNEITLGTDLSEEERSRAVSLLREYADCFALSLSEVTTVDGATHKLNIPDRNTTKFRTKPNQRPLSGPQKEYYNGVIDNMLDAGIIEPIDHKDVKCCGATTLAKKAHEGGGLTIEELQHRLNDECVTAGFPSAFENLPPRETTPETHGPDMPEKPTKWRVCQDFADLNKVTKVPAMPQGDIRAKQQRLSGHRWVSVFDFAAGFYACEMAEEDRPYICFYVEGRGYFSYKRMPFGLTGAPSTFAEMTARNLGDLVGTLFELFVDDGGMAGDDFDIKLGNIRQLLTRVREKKLSLSAAKSSFFMTESVFAGARVGPKGIRPDLTKLTAIVDWKTPTDVQNLTAFTGLTGYFRSLVKGYAVMAQPLTDLARSLDIPRGKGKAAYRRAMKGHSLQGIWKPEHDRAFLRLKVALTSEPVLKGPRFDGTPFIVTTDGCKFGFAGMLSQQHKTVLPNGKEVTRMHPIAFCGKRTSVTEEKYKPYLLEFAALKFSLDKFSDVVWGYPIELETDCQALRDHLMNDKLNSTHARWRDGVLAYQIMDVRHRPGRLNLVADGISRKYVNLPKESGDGHEWTVSEDWEARTGLQNDIFRITEASHLSAYTSLRERFVKEKIFLEVIDSLLELDQGRSLRERKKARHRAQGYMIEDGKLWRVGDTKSVRAKARVECISESEAVARAWHIHREKGHFHRDLVKIEMLDKFCSPRLDRSITTAIMDCGKCKSFGPTHLHSLLEPITRRHPFELIVADTLSMPKGKGGFVKLGLYLDTYSQHIWVDKLKKPATGASTTKKYNEICTTFTTPEALMVDGGSEFDNNVVREACAARGTELRVVPAYSPWINGLVENANGKLLGRLKRMCAPDLGEDEYERMKDVPETWPDHLDAAVEYLNNRILPHLKFSPNELLLGLVINTNRTPHDIATHEPTATDIAVQMAYMDQQRVDGYASIVDHAQERKAKFDRKVMGRAPKEVVFKAGQLVQVYRNDLDYTFKVERKMEPKWSAPRRVTSRDRNSYSLETLEGLPIGGRFSSRRLRRFIPRNRTQLQEAQEAVEGERAEDEREADLAEDRGGVNGNGADELFEKAELGLREDDWEGRLEEESSGDEWAEREHLLDESGVD